MTDEEPAPRIGVFVEWLSDGYSESILDEIAETAAARGVDIRCFVGGSDSLDVPLPRRHMPAVYASTTNLDGAVVVSMGNGVTSKQIEEYFARLETIPLVGVAVQWSRFASVEVDNETGVRAGVRHLIRTHGRRRIACIRGPLSSTEADKRYRAYCDVLAEFGVEFDDRLVTTGHYIRASGVDAVCELLDRRRVEFDAIVAANDSMALGALDELERRGVRVPQAVSLLGFDDIDEGRHARPPLSTVRQPVRAHGRRAFELVLESLGGKAIPRCTRIDTNLVLRKSCGCVTSRGKIISSSWPPPNSQAAGASLSTWSAAFCTALVEFLGPSDVDAFRRELELSVRNAVLGKDSSSVIATLEPGLTRFGRARGDLLLALPILESMRRSVSTLSENDTAIDNLDSMVREVAVAVSELAERLQAERRYRAELQIDRLLRMNESLQQAMSFGALAEVIARELPALGIRACYVCVWEGQQVPTEWATLVIACNGGDVVPLPAGGWRFPAEEILPKALARPYGPSTWLICPVGRREATITAYVVMIRGNADSFVYDSLVDQIGSNLKRLALIDQLLCEVALREAAERERIQRELEIATRIQTGILPQRVSIRGLEFSCGMRPATEVGGDYYDIIAVENGCWIGIGDVAGHGLPTGLVMVMCQSVIGGLVRDQPNAEPGRLLVAANRLLYDNIRSRMCQDEHVTLALVRYHEDGRLDFAGAHEPLLIWRARTGRVESVQLDGVWTGIVEDIAPMTPAQGARLEPRDLLVLYTDGITEARNAAGEVFGEARLFAAIEELHQGSVSEIREGILRRVDAWMTRQDDDMTLVVARYAGAAGTGLLLR